MVGTAPLPEDDRVAVAADAVAPGAMIGRFVVRARLGAGGMGVVYAADDPDLGRAVAIKLVSPEVDRPALRARLLREAQAMAQLDHPHVVRVHEVGEHGGRLFLAMELIEGETLTRWLAAGPRPWREVLAMFEQVGRGLVAVHGAGLVHRDVKPDNVLVDRTGRARVADLGLVRAEPERAGPASPALAATLTRTGVAMGTPGYMAPEQQRGAKVDAAADQYSYCVALREALHACRPAPPRALRAALSRGLAFEPGERFPSMTALLAALARAARVRTRRLALGGAVTVVGGGVAAAVVLALGARSPTPVTLATAAVTADAGAAAPTPGDAAPARAPAADGDGPPTDADAPAGRGRRRDAGVRLLPPPPLVPSTGRGRGSAATAPPLAELRTIDPAHLPALQAAIHDLGYRGIVLADLDDDLATSEQSFRDGRARMIAAGTQGELGFDTATVILGMILRRQGDCAGAEPLWRDAARALAARPPSDPQFRTAYLWWGRAWFGVALCRLDAGDAAGAARPLRHAASALGTGGKAELAEEQLVAGILDHERGAHDDGARMLMNLPYTGDDRVRRALTRWAAAYEAGYP